MSFLAMHYCLFILVPLIVSILFWAISTSKEHVSYMDSVFFCISALTEAGGHEKVFFLAKLKLVSNTAQQIILFLLTVTGSPLVTSAAVLAVRKNAFEGRLNAISERRSPIAPEMNLFPCRLEQGPLTTRTNSTCSTALTPERTSKDDQKHDLARNEPHIHQNNCHISTCSSHTTLCSPVSLQDPSVTHHPNNSKDEEEPEALPRRFPKLDKYINTAHGYIGRNSAIRGLTFEEKCALGGVEYRAITFLSWAVPVYIIVWQLLGVIAVGTWFHVHLFEASTQNGLNAFWNGAFFAVSAFNNSGMALLDTNATAFQTNYFPLLTLGLLILAGNTCFPPFLRLSVWIIKYSIPQNTLCPLWRERRRTLSFILDHPRRVYTHLFPSSATWWLVATLFLLNGIDWLAFILFNLGNPAVEFIPARYRVLDGLFQALAVRVGGFAVVSIANLRPALLTLYVVMMYISVYPITMAIRSTNVYEEQSLGIFPEDPRNPYHASKHENKAEAMTEDRSRNRSKHSTTLTTFRSLTRTFIFSTNPPHYGTSNELNEPRSFLHHQLALQLSHDFWWIALAVILIQLVETSQSLADPVTFSMFNILFEVVSAYGTVGISTGVPWDFYSFSGAWHATSKLVLCAVMLRGRHRGLPVEVDRAVMLPGDRGPDKLELEPLPSLTEDRRCSCGTGRANGACVGGTSASEETLTSSSQNLNRS